LRYKCYENFTTDPTKKSYLIRQSGQPGPERPIELVEPAGQGIEGTLLFTDIEIAVLQK
jgi:hypothetical protein